jgi:hypothetical protein
LEELPRQRENLRRGEGSEELPHLMENIVRGTMEEAGVQKILLG